MTPNSLPKDEFILGLPPLVAPLVAQTVFGHQKLAPSAAQVLPMIEKSTKNDTKEHPNCEKELPKCKPFRNLTPLRVPPIDFQPKKKTLWQI